MTVAEQIRASSDAEKGVCLHQRHERHGPRVEIHSCVERVKERRTKYSPHTYIHHTHNTYTHTTHTHTYTASHLQTASPVHPRVSWHSPSGDKGACAFYMHTHTHTQHSTQHKHVTHNTTEHTTRTAQHNTHHNHNKTQHAYRAAAIVSAVNR